jgi:glutathione S-transferase
MRGAQPNEIIVGELTKTFTAKLAIFEGILAKQQYMGGDEFSLIDIFYMPYTAMLFVSGDSELITSNPNLAAWWERVTARESWKKVNA